MDLGLRVQGEVSLGIEGTNLVAYGDMYRGWTGRLMQGQGGLTAVLCIAMSQLLLCSLWGPATTTGVGQVVQAWYVLGAFEGMGASCSDNSNSAGVMADIASPKC